MALIHYLMAAESGFASAQFNVAYLCEQNPVSSNHIYTHSYNYIFLSHDNYALPFVLYHHRVSQKAGRWVELNGPSSRLWVQYFLIMAAAKEINDLSHWQWVILLLTYSSDACQSPVKGVVGICFSKKGQCYALSVGIWYENWQNFLSVSVVTFICFSPQGGFLTQVSVKQCMLRYYNLTVQSQDPDVYGNWHKIIHQHVFLSNFVSTAAMSGVMYYNVPSNLCLIMIFVSQLW